MKAYFIDYTGTMVQEDEPYTRELLGYFLSHSDLNTPGEALKVVWEQVKEISQRPLCTIGGHTVSHLALNQLNDEDFFKESDKTD